VLIQLFRVLSEVIMMLMLMLIYGATVLSFYLAECGNATDNFSAVVTLRDSGAVYKCTDHYYYYY